MSKSENRGEAIGHFIGDLIGFVWYLFLLSGAYGLGSWAAQYFIGEAHRDAMGLLAAIAAIWMIERERADKRGQQINDKLERLFSRMNP